LPVPQLIPRPAPAPPVGGVGKPPPGGFAEAPDSSNLAARHESISQRLAFGPRAASAAGSGAGRKTHSGPVGRRGSAMSGERDLARLLAGLAPALDDRPYAFVPYGDGPLDSELVGAALGLVREREGVTLVLPEALALARGFPAGPPWARIELTVHSDLEAVGMMAAVAGALAAEGISCNPLAGYHHDHVFVPWPRREDAVRALQRLARRP